MFELIRVIVWTGMSGGLDGLEDDLSPEFTDLSSPLQSAGTCLSAGPGL